MTSDPLRNTISEDMYNMVGVTCVDVIVVKMLQGMSVAY